MMKFITIIWLTLFASFGLKSQDITIEKHTFKYTLNSKYKLECEEFKRFTINTEEGYESSKVVYDYYDEFRKIQKFNVTIYDRNGKKVSKFNKNSAFDISYNQSYEMSDNRILLIEPDYGAYPFTIEIEKSISSDGFIGLSPWLPLEEFNTQVDEASMEFWVEKGMDVYLREENGITGTIESISDKSGDWTKYSWTARDMKAIDDDITYKQFFDEQPKVRITPVQFSYDDIEGSFVNWGEFGEWYLKINLNRDSLTQETIDFVKSRDLKNKRKTIEELYKFMQNRTRYVSIQLGIGGFQTIPALEVDKTGFGDCKALTNYMYSMLKYAGIPSNYVLVKAGTDVPDVIEEFPSNQFNHVFLGIPLANDTIYLECTSQKQPFGYLGSFTDDRNVLWIDHDKKSKIIRSPTYDENTNIITTKNDLIFNKKGDATFKIEMTKEGSYFNEYMYYSHMNQDEMSQYNYKQFDYKDYTISNFNYQEPSNNEPKFELSFELDVRNLAKNASSRLLLPFNPGNNLDHYITYNKYKQFAKVSRAMTLKDHYEISLEEGLYLQQLPTNHSFENEYGSYEISASFSDDKIIIDRKVILKRGEYKKQDFESFSSFMKEVNSQDNEKLIFESKT